MMFGGTTIHLGLPKPIRAIASEPAMRPRTDDESGEAFRD
jgi:hypothetical protein